MITPEGVNGTTCNAQQYQQSLSLTSPTPCLTHGQSIGLALTAEASFISFICILIIHILIGRNVLRHRKALQNGDLKLLRAPADIYMLSLFMFGTIQAVGGILNVRWVHDGQVTAGPYCSAQGIIKHIGAVGTALITLILAVHTFIAALWGIGSKACGFAFGLVGLTCIFIVLWVGIENGTHRNYEVPVPYWCWVSPRFQRERMAGQHVWLWVALFASVVMYLPLYLWTEGRLSIGDRWYKFRLSHTEHEMAYVQRRASLGMLFYPLAYAFVVLPLFVSHWSQKNANDSDSAAVFFGESTFNLSGTINVLLFLIFRPQLLLFSPNTVQCNCSSETAGMGPVDDLEGRSWNLTVEGSRRIGPRLPVGSMQGPDGI